MRTLFIALVVAGFFCVGSAQADDDCKGSPQMVREGRSFTVKLLPSDSSKSLLADGNYNLATVAPYLSAEPRGGKPRTFRAELVWFQGAVSTTEVEERLKELGLRPLTGQEALAFGSQHPAIQVRGSLAALGRAYVVGGEAKYMQLVGLSDGRGVTFADGRCWPGGKKTGTRFLATKSTEVRR